MPRRSIFDNHTDDCLMWIKENYLDTDTPWETLDDLFGSWSLNNLGRRLTFSAVYSWAQRNGYITETRSGAPTNGHKEQDNGDIATLVEIIYGLESLTAEQKFNAAKELIKD